MHGERFFNDDPVDGSADAPDLLGRQQYAQHAVELLHQVRDQSESGVLALIGPWGSGKSSVLQMAIQHLKNAVSSADTRVWSVAELNPWMYSDLESLTLALFSEIRAALPDDGQWSELRKKVGAFGQSVSPLGKLTGLLGLDSSELIKLVAERVAGDTSASAAKRTAEAALRQAALPVLVVMDDLDRLTPEELLVVFKLIRLVGHLPNVYYLVSFDEQTLLDVLQRTDLAGSNDQRAQEFLEKLIQVRLDLPAFRDRDVEVMATRLLNALLDSHGVSMTPEQEQRFSEAYFRHLQDRLRTPRAIKRYFGQASATLGSLAGEVDLVDFLIVTFLRTSEPGVYRMLGRHRGELTGTSIDPALRHDARPGERAERWKERLSQAGVTPDNLDGLLALLGLMFPTIQQAVGNGGAAAAHRRGIGSSDYFDRYVVFTVPADDLPEAAFEQALAQLQAGTHGDQAAELLVRLRQDTHRIIRRIDQARTDGAPVPAAALLQALADNYGHLTAQPEAMGLLSADRRVRFLAPALLLDLPPDQRPAVVAAMAGAPVGAVLATRTLHRATNPDDTASERVQISEEWAVQARDALTGRLAEHLTPAAHRPATDLTEQDSELIWMWRHTDPASIRTWLLDRLDNGWELLPFLAKLITPRHLPFPLIDNETWAGLDALFTHTNLYTRLAPYLDNPDAPQPTDQHQTDILHELRNRRPNPPPNHTHHLS
ncbi:P-loop NTPase fold protein [Streptomyces goshikiensis]|uniref:KAP family P-loop NTPase fold protein n=1 Tax=Streptomyces goshikiensis TaxID=1942 RepID=UPI0036BDFDCA